MLPGEEEQGFGDLRTREGLLRMWKQKWRKYQTPLKGNEGLLWGLITALSKGPRDNTEHLVGGGWGVKKQRRKADRGERGINWGEKRTESVLAEGPLYFSS